MALRLLLFRPAVLVSVALHGAVAVALWTAPPPPRADTEACVCGMFADPTDGPLDAIDVPADPALPRDAPEVVAVAPADEPLPEEEVPELEAPSLRADAHLPLLDRAPIGVRTSLRPAPASPTPAAAPGPSGVVPLPPSAAPSSASQRGLRATTVAVGEPTNRPPAYPLEALRHGWEGTTFVRVEVLEDGRIGQSFVETSSGFAALDAAALEAIRAWRYRPRTVDGVPARDLLRVPFRFRLRAS